MPIFFRQAYEAVCDGKLPTGLTPAHFADWKRLGEALDWLTPEQKCDAAYADWLLQLNCPARQALLQVRNLLIGQGALAANYLAELAQNADDASDGNEAQLRVIPDGEWLFVSNNGRKVTAGNLLGLCRFFVHSGGKIVDLNERTIGRFGIGFKSSYRIASEVFVHTWDKAGAFTFRLPISRQEDKLSHPDPSRLERLLSSLRKAGISEFDPELRDVKCLGYCTPEHVAQLPPHLAAATERIRRTDKGTLFCFHIRADRRADVAARITGQAHEVYELCPLFLPNLRLVQLGPNELSISVTRRDPNNDIPGLVKAEKVTLVTQSVGKASQNPSRARFWRLTGAAPQDRWQVALHADNEHRLHVEHEKDETGTTIKDGAAYAFFPLNAVNWPFHLHLHINLSTNLARDNWNPDDKAQVEEQITRAVSGMAAWLEKHPNKQHPLWRIEALITRKPNANETWAWQIWEELIKECRSRRLLRTPWGSHVTAQRARTVRLVEKEGARKAWEEFCAGLTGLTDEFPIINASGVLDFGLDELPEAELKRFFLKAVEASPDDDAKRRLASALFVVTSANPATLEAVADRLQVPYSNGSLTTLATLMRRPAGSDLPDAWHATFKALTQLLWDDPEHHGWTSILDGQLRFQLKKLSERVINYTWQQIPVSLAQKSAWETAGPNFWKLDRESCPAGLRKTVILTLRAKDAGTEWTLLTDYWLVNNTTPQCFRGLFSSWSPGPNSNYAPMREVVDKLRTWGLWEAWEDAVEAELRQQLQAALLEKLNTSRAPSRLFEDAFSTSYETSKDLLPARWRAVTQEVEERVLRLFVTQHSTDLPSGILLASDIPTDFKEILLLNPDFKPAPAWLTPAALKRLQATGAFGTRQPTLLTVQHLDDSQKRQITAAILQNFHKWASRTFTPGQISAFNELCDATPDNLRGNWAVGLTTRSTDLLKDMVNPSTAPSAETSKTVAGANQPLLLHPKRKWIRIKELPQLLRLIPAISEACLQPDELTVRVASTGHPLPITLEQVTPDVITDPLFKRMLQTCGGSVMSSPGALDVQWLRDDDLVAELRDAPFAVKDGHLLTTRVEKPAEETQYTEILSLYSRKGRGDEHFQRFQELWQKGERSHPDLYAEFREHVLATLLQTEVHDLGYRPHHIARELLQNAESAYDSLPAGTQTTADFKMVSRHMSELGAWVTTAEHSGRHFNQPLRSGEPRDDIRLIVSIPSAEQPPTEGWIGRFNRGFKSIFTITETVKIVSGPYAFSVQDMLLLNPPKPQPTTAPPTPRTCFTFRCPKSAALRLFMLSKTDAGQPPLAIFNCSSFVLLRNIRLVHLQLDSWQWVWRLERRIHRCHWTEVDIAQSHPPLKENFLVASSEISPGTSKRSYRYAVALRLANSPTSIQPALLDAASHKIRLTFETEDEFPLDFIVNGDFETDSGRLGIRNSSINESLLVACLRAVKELCSAELTRLNDKPHWLAWAAVVHLSTGENDLAKRFETHHKDLVREFDSLADFLCSHVPHNNGVADAKTLLFPSPLLRKLQTFVQAWGFPVQRWIDPKIEAQLPKPFLDKRRKLSLPDLLQDLLPDAALRRRIRQDLDSAAFRAAHGPLDAVASGELSRARDLLQDNTPPPPPFIVENWSVADLWNWWERRGKPTSEYTLEGPENWKLLFADDQGDTASRGDRLKADLLAATSDNGKRIWYRLFGLACLMSAGRRMSEIRSFWYSQLDGRQFWDRTSNASFGSGTDALFTDLVTRPFANLAANGEHAYFWRRVFYDIRKIHKLVWESEFPATLLDLIRSGHGQHLLNFLRTGHLPGQPSWVGVFGQSAGSPLFFLIRELCRLGIITDPAVKPLAFFVSTPVRRAMERIGWLGADLGNRVDFESLASLSESLHLKLSSDRQFGPRLLEFYDIPLLHLGLEG